MLNNQATGMKDIVCTTAAFGSHADSREDSQTDFKEEHDLMFQKVFGSSLHTKEGLEVGYTVSNQHPWALHPWVQPRAD